jgi:hypothetical protein
MNESIWLLRRQFGPVHPRIFPAARPSEARRHHDIVMPVDMDIASFTSLLKTFRAEFPLCQLLFATSTTTSTLLSPVGRPVSYRAAGFLARFERYARTDLAEWLLLARGLHRYFQVRPELHRRDRRPRQPPHRKQPQSRIRRFAHHNARTYQRAFSNTACIAFRPFRSSSPLRTRFSFAV